MKSRLILALLAATLLPALPATAYTFSAPNADGVIIYYNTLSGSQVAVTYKDGNNYNSYSGDVVIPAEVEYNGTIYPVTEISSLAFKECSTLTSIVIPDGVKTIGSYSFEGCKSLTSLNIPNSVTSIGSDAFLDCSSLVGVNIPESVTSIGSYAFRGCSKLTSINIPEGVTKISNSTFQNCSSLTSIVIPESVTSIGDYAFCNCSSLTDINIPDGVTFIGNYAFYGCSSLTSVVIPEGVPTIGSDAFCECTSLTSVVIPEGVTTIGSDAFYGCSNLTDINIHEGVTYIGFEAFRNCSKLSSIVIPASLSSLGTNAFADCTCLVDITLNSNTPVSYGFGSDKVFFVPEESVEAYRAAWPDHVTEILPIGAMTDFTIEAQARDNSSDLMDMINCEVGSFNAELNVVRLKVKGTINSYDIMTMRNKMRNLCYLDLSEANIVENSYEYYAGCHSENNVLGANIFNGNTKLRSVILPESITTIGNYAFRSCNNLTEIVIPDAVLTIGSYAFNYCANLRTVHIGESVKTIYAYAFASCSNLESVHLGESVETIYSYAFYSSSKLKNINFPPSLNSIGSYAFSSCTSLKSIMLPTSLTRIEDTAFSDCSSLKEVKIPASIEYIGDYAFNTGSIRDIYTWTVQPININQSTFNDLTYSNATLHVPETAKKLYYWDTQWSQFANVTQFNEPYTYFYLADKDLEIDANTERLQGEPEADLRAGSGIIVEGDESQDLGEVTLNSDGGSSAGSIIGGDSATEASEANVNIDDLSIKITITKNRWYFFAFPFDIPYANIHFNGQFVWRWYDGGLRAANGSGAWRNVEGSLVAGRGYIFQASKDGTLTLNIGAVAIGGKDKMIALESHISANIEDASWNLVGNPFTSYYELCDLGYSAPITIWNAASRTYEAVSPQDDDLTIYPYQAFFVQKPEGVSGIGFEADARETKNQSEDPNYRAAARQRRMARSAGDTDRLIVNIEISDAAGNTDRTRVVFNDSRSLAYEPECDASKFMSTEVAQIYTLDSRNIYYAINERPTDEGTVRLGFTAPYEGTFTIYTRRTDCPMEIVDLATGKTAAMVDGYTFTASAGTDNDRFIIRRADISGIDSAKADADDAQYFGIDGISYGSNAPAGIAIRRSGNNAEKVVIK